MKPSKAGWWWATVDGIKKPVEIKQHGDELAAFIGPDFRLLELIEWHGLCIEVCPNQFAKNFEGDVFLVAADDKGLYREVKAVSIYYLIGLVYSAINHYVKMP